MDYQQTIALPATLSGIGLHTGVAVTLRLTPAPANTGIAFKRTDLDNFLIEARARNVAHVSYATSLMKKGVLISTTEHLLSALAAAGVDNVYAELDNLELPIADGSARPFMEMIAKAGLKRQRARRIYARVLKPVEIVDGGKRISVRPADEFRVTYRILFPHPLIGEQTIEFVASSRDYDREIAPARTFGFYEEVEMLRKSGLIKGGSLENAVVLTRDGVLNPEGLRFRDEFCRHKVLDLIGDLALLGHPLIGHVFAERAGHAVHAALVDKLLRNKDTWELVDSTAFERREARSEAPVLASQHPV
ncbi:MAG: UDP-3-O-acyl-N-acetylglucosamine deacetylase [Deltaproteobacteria bacterium]